MTKSAAHKTNFLERRNQDFELILLQFKLSCDHLVHSRKFEVFIKVYFQRMRNLGFYFGVATVLVL